MRGVFVYRWEDDESTKDIEIKESLTTGILKKKLERILDEADEALTGTVNSFGADDPASEQYLKVLADVAFLRHHINRIKAR